MKMRAGVPPSCLRCWRFAGSSERGMGLTPTFFRGVSYSATDGKFRRQGI